MARSRKKTATTPSEALLASLSRLEEQGVELRPIGEVKRRTGNPRDNAEAVPSIIDSLQTFGWTNPIIVDQTGTIEAGDTRLLAALHLKLEKVPVLVTTHDEKDARRYTVADNRTNEVATWNPARLLEFTRDFSEEDLMPVGFSAHEIEAMSAKVLSEEDKRSERGAPFDVDEALEESAVPKRVEKGDVWQCGNHVVICGDSRLVAPVGDACAMLFTDPPYGVNYHSRLGRDPKTGKQTQKRHATIQNDDMTPEQLEEFLREMFDASRKWLTSNATAYIFHSDQKPGLRPAFEEAFFVGGFSLLGCIIWVKPTATMGWQDYRNAYEPILFGKVTGDNPHRSVQDRTQTTVWDERKDAASSYMHPTQKPISLAIRAMRNSTMPGDRVLDCFGGSGSTLIAGEVVKRRVVSIELEPRYCDVAIERWVRLSGGTPKLLTRIEP